MNPKQFLRGLGITLILQLFVNGLLWLALPELRSHTPFLLVCIIGIACFCFGLYAAARIVARSTQARLYIQLVMIAVFLKLAFCLALVVIYKQVFNPSDNSFIWSFLFIYITSTIFEVIFLEKVGRQKNVT
jgi:hypothetical protein